MPREDDSDSVDLEEFPYVDADAGSINVEHDEGDEITLHELLTLLEGKQQ